ncbi:E3 ubiquitin-protein ligase UBR2 [Neodiprion lecontei]|uniref:E3 ubiquitin-protein ligase n=1 Tax=Neodiprion lecontei TaxID=441921 RepID=A0A6J0BKZ6_NEOLC|nr:E3 ubiquitin-protein ligase UBR2 [Neodiprion lecontei]XP_015515355.1 E3 ubiquitin-protein ligase UBR2 [Neodiprion lecontei]XP_046598551.1 E3 ubiquitin-protein ligase UBR2 [Neodiprion lecontei]XP_046598552.1 E3 ubiquitin-protein ligase UBR2 [Neodiprion lecontei]
MSNDNMQHHQHHHSGDVELALVLPTFPKSRRPCVNVWMDKMSKGLLSCAHFKEHWRIWVPKIYSPEPNGSCLDWSFNEEKAQKILYSSLEEFICNGNPQEVLQQLSQLDNPPSVCGKVFKMGEPTYSCRECGMDSTCVLCVVCFKQSAHRNHKYKMGTSSGGGCCDCGDPEAWKNDSSCSIHKAGIQFKSRPRNKLPEDIAERAKATFEAVLKYSYELLSLEHVPGLPSDLCLKGTDEDPLSLQATSDTYCTVLFNDETHTFEQVIGTLSRVIKCSHRDAIEFVTNIDREGRAVVKCSTFQHCTELKSEIERFTSRHGNRPLKVLVVHADVVAHQLFAMKLLAWLQEFMAHSEGFRIAFSNVALHTKLSDVSIVEGILMRDSQLWKAARTAWHRLFISGMLVEYESKKALASVFTYNYGTVMKDFIRDDHDHSFSIAALSVQLFTVPTLTHYLIAHNDVLFILLNTFISESSRKCNAQGKLEFERNSANQTFKRAQHILYDLRYLLSAKPDTWTDELRHGFLQGLSIMLKLLCSMQGMDAVSRQVGQHIEFEPEWESAFNLHIKLAPVISLTLEWCGSDRTVFIKAFRLVLKKLYELPGNDLGPGQVRELANHSASCLQYDVSTEPVSIHLPLSRFLAGLFLYLERYNLEFQSSEFMMPTKPTPEQIIEPVLRTQAMFSQVHAGMWRRNGYSIMNQLFFYHNVKCRTEMLDKDIVLLQTGACLIESNEFLIHLLNRFNLLNWANPEFEANTLKNPEEDSMRQTISLVEEFLGLLITIIGERYTPGVGNVDADDRLKKEIIQQLCIKPLPHSELNKTLPDDVHHETGMERVIDDLANFKKPLSSSAGKGVYELKPEFYADYNVFFYHYTREEFSKSEEEQRKRRKAAHELECCPPPKLPKLTETYSLVANLLQCDVMLHLMQTVLERALNLRARSYSEPQVQRLLHLIGYALQEEESGYYAFFRFTERSTKWEIYKLLEQLSHSPRLDAHKDLVTWTLEKYQELLGYTPSEARNVPSSAPSTEQNSEPEANKMDKEWRTQMAAQQRARIMAQMATMQKNFMKENAKLFEETALEGNKANDRGSNLDISEFSEQAPVAVGINQTSRICEEETYTCILCQEDQPITATGPAMVLAAFVQQSTVLCQNRVNTDEPNPLFLSDKLGAAPHTSTCGHVMHAQCWQKYLENVHAKESRRPYRTRQPASFDIDKQEYLCPLCECLSNTILPLLPPLGSLQMSKQNKDNVDFSMWLRALVVTLSCKVKVTHGVVEYSETSHDLYCRYCTVVNPQDSVERFDEEVSLQHQMFACPIERVSRELGDVGASFEALYAQTGPHLSKNLIGMIHLFAQATYTKGLDVEPHDGDPRVPLLAWKSTVYTIHTIEFILRDMEKPLLGALTSRLRDSLKGLVRIAAFLGSTWPNTTVIGNHALHFLTMLLENPHDGPSVLDWDPLGVLIPLTVSLMNLYNIKANAFSGLVTGGVQESHALKLVFLSLIVRILVTMEYNENEVMDIDNKHWEDQSVLKFTEELGLKVGSYTASELWRRVQAASIPFLRACVLYFHYLTDVPAPAELTIQGGDTYENMCKYLGLPVRSDELLDSEAVVNLAKLWVAHPKVQQYLSGTSTIVVTKDPLMINKLVDLPEDYSELINAVSLFTCPNSDREDSRNPTMCLVCGEMLCSQSYCCQVELNKVAVGACIYHASKCGAGVGLFLRVRECEILFLRSPTRGSVTCPPYLDEYGETDQGLRRGNPLRLCRDHYKQLNQLWLGHGLHETIARAVQSSSTLITMQWQHL